MVKITVRLIVALAAILFVAGAIFAGELSEIYSPEAAAEAARIEVMTPIEAELAQRAGDVQLRTTEYVSYWIARIFVTSAAVLSLCVVAVFIFAALRSGISTAERLRSARPATKRVGDLVIIDERFVFDTVTGRYFAIDTEQPAELSRAQVAQVRFFMRGMAEIVHEAQGGDSFARSLLDWVLPVLSTLPPPGAADPVTVFQAESANQNHKTEETKTWKPPSF